MRFDPRKACRRIFDEIVILYIYETLKKKNNNKAMIDR